MTFTITQNQNQYLTYCLKDEEADAYLEVVPARGGIITRWQICGEDILYLDRERFKEPNLSVRGGVPILFPICGNLPDNTYQHQGRNYSLKQHGFARDLPWQVSKQSTETAASLTLELNSNPATRQVYPFDFQLIFTYQLQGNSLKIHQKVINLSPEKMPFSIGFHPYFQVTDKTRLSFDIPSSQYLDQRSKTLHSYSGHFDFNLEEIDAAFPQITRHQSSFSDSYHQRQIILGYDDLYTTIVFWTLKDKNYICLEPWSAPRNALNTGEQLTYLEPQSSREAIVEMRVNQI
ncbi:MAG: aldose epimerase [Microcystis aeruginosa LL13-03]|jgi:galactose mutarotase-like enzyme|nr:aldose epimerase [Microcystis aeruginosa LL13-03]NCR45166.1 aldose epimerase [Microcystis aeruginosa SX13-01]NCR68477.1 aldose epimerase [Microcystis aeruginosa LL11-07]NCR90534.1 aldose epimerase [Microcystis aeruginosa G13-10]NCS17362.1 aldose epimerase [Microcystis aeruginosa G13-12]NCS19426.1 aldose epimerase [Microcystis aeruginosa G11-06]NCS35798.1 aldose epimerase [Microcystis aeruginosa G11-01]NCT52101.1 aldose epimerase [Microcystis aeruginosa G13-03]NCT64854.1 aldose epimerase 